MAEPVLWLKERSTPGRKVKARQYNPTTKAWEDVLDDRGNPVLERVPNVGTVVDDRGQVRPMAVRRFVKFLKADGHITSVPLTAAAASQPGTDRSQSEYIFAKGKYFGWVEWGHCPIEEHHRDPQGFAVQKLAAKANRAAVKDNKRCAHWLRPGDPNPVPCAHWLAEVEARRAFRVEDDAKLAEAHKSAADKQADALKDFVATMADRTTTKGKE